MKRYNAMTARLRKGSRITYIFSMTDRASFRLSRGLMDTIGAGPGQCVEVFQDDDGEWYIAKHDDGFRLSKGGTFA